MVKNLIRGLIVLASLVAVFLLCSKVLMLKSEDGIEQLKSFYLQEDDTVDVLFVGSSHLYCNVNTGTLWDDYGISSFNLGGAEQPFWNSYYYIKEALKTQKPKVIVMSVTIPGIRTDDFQSENWLITNLYGMKWGKNRIEATKESTLPQSFERLLIPMYTIHSRYGDLTKDDFIDKNYDIAYKGYDLRKTVIPFDTPDISGVTEMTPITEKQEKWLRKVIELTQEENVPLLLVAVPFVVSEDSQKVYNYEFAIADETGTDYIDFNKLYNEMGLDFQTDMAEDLHLNISGSQKFTKYLGQCLLDRYDISDHRGDARYSSWDKDALIHRQELAFAALQSTGEIHEYLGALANSQYITFMNFGENITPESLDGIKDQLAALGIDYNSIGGQSAVITNGSSMIFNSSDNDFTYFIDEGIDKLMFKRTCEEEGSPSTNIYINNGCYAISSNDISILVFDRCLKQTVGYIICNPYDCYSVSKYL